MDSPLKHHFDPAERPDCLDVSPERLNPMTAAQLERELEAALEAMTEAEYDPAVIDAYLDALDRKAPMPDHPDAGTAYAGFQARVQRAAGQVSGRRASRRSRVRLRTLLRVAAAAQDSQTDRRDVPEEYHEIYNKLKGVGCSTFMFPAYIPDGFQVTETKLHSNANDENVKFVMLYEDGTDYLIFQVSHGGDSSFPIYEKDSQSVEIYNQNDIDYYIFTNLASLVSVWSKDHTEYSVSTTLSLPALKEIIDSVFEEVIEQ
ncbi:MAG: DUF4367 domain-containing protein [Lawsonibacter sp.]